MPICFAARAGDNPAAMSFSAAETVSGSGRGRGVSERLHQPVQSVEGFADGKQLVLFKRCCMDRSGDGTRPFPKPQRQAIRSNTGRPSAVIVFRTFWPTLISVICLENRRDWSLGPMNPSALPVLIHQATPKPIRRAQRQVCLDRQIRVSPLATPRRAARRAPHTLSLITDPNREITPLAQALVIFCPVDHPVLRLIKLVPSRCVELMWHPGYPLC